MAPNDTNTPKEARRHAVPLIGMALSVVFVLLLFFWWVFHVTDGSENTQATPTEQPAAPQN